MRYALIACGAYVIFNVSLAGLYGFLGGVCLPIAAIACEVAVEIFVSAAARNLIFLNSFRTHDTAKPSVCQAEV